MCKTLNTKCSVDLNFALFIEGNVCDQDVETGKRIVEISVRGQTAAG